MKVIHRPFEGCFVLEPTVFEDARGFFYEFYNKRTFERVTGLQVDFVQDNLAGSVKNVFRGMHFQKPPYQQAKLISVTEGKILDVIADIRPGSPTFGQWYAVELSEQNHLQLFIPKGFAHGYLVLSDRAKVFYKTDEFYRPEYDSGFRFDDPRVGIRLPVPRQKLILSEKDKHLPSFDEIVRP